MSAPFSDLVFDCDSTLSRIEGIDELAQGAEEVAALTREAMAGRIPLEQVYGRRLALLAPDRAAVERVGRAYVEALTPDARETLAALRSLGKRVHLVSGGIRQAVLVLARALGVEERDVHAVPLRFSAAGTYQGYDSAHPLARSGGKVEILRALRAISDAGAASPVASTQGSRRFALVGDGITDAEAAGEVELFVGFGGVVDRPEVRARAAVWVGSPSLCAVLEVLLDAGERARLCESAAFAALVQRAEALARAGFVLRRAPGEGARPAPIP